MPAWLETLIKIAEQVPELVSLIEQIIKAISGSANLSEGVKKVRDHMDKLK